jgi:CHASE2 domain-containing sensor protein
MWAFSGITQLRLFNAFDPISAALAEFELTDYVFSKIRPDPLPDTRIVLVNIGQLPRREIARQIQIISQHHPKVIGIDSFFDCEGGLRDTVNCPALLDTLGNLMLSNAIQQAGNVVLVSRLLQRHDTFKKNIIDLYDSIEYSDPLFSDFATNAFANLPTGATYQEDVKICKKIIPRMVINGKEELAFSVAIAKKYDSVKTEAFLDRNNWEETINFRGNAGIEITKIAEITEQMESTTNYRLLCYAIDWNELLNGNYLPAMFENNIVLMGYLGDFLGDPSWEDKFFTPLNTKVAGRANPDMFGPVIHANVIAMILNQDYVNELEEWQAFLIAFIICFLNVGLFSWVDRKLPIWFDGLSVIIQVTEILVSSFIIVMVFAYFNFKLDLTLTIGAMALIGPCFDIYKSFENTLFKRFTQRSEKVLTS